MIETKNLSKIYNPGKFEVKAVNSVSSLFEEGEFTSVVGPSGSGKTTFLNCVGGLDKPTSGNVYISGENITSLSGSDIIQYRLKNIGFVFQAYNLIPVLSARENIEMIMLLQGTEEKNRVEWRGSIWRSAWGGLEMYLGRLGWLQEAPGGIRRLQEAPGGSRRL